LALDRLEDAAVTTIGGGTAGTAVLEGGAEREDIDESGEVA
jgi:Ethanolamine utilization protein EutJ (predicted chaperonin)